MTSKQFTKKLNQVLTLVLTIAALAVGQSAWAASSFTIDASYNSSTHKTTFTITRTGNTALAETIDWRVVSLSAIAGQHFTVDDQSGYDGTATFSAGISTASVTISENTPGTDAYKYQTGTERSYRFEVLDRDGYILASKDRSMTTGTSVPSSGAFNIKDVTIYSSEYTADDRGYDNNGYKSVSSSAYFTSSNAPKAYLQQISAQLRMTLSFQGKENDDAYEYLQLLFDNTSSCDNRSGCSNGDPGNISHSSYMAGFEMNTGAKDDTYRTYTFPVTSVGDNEGATDPWGYDPTNHKWPLKKQKFKSGSRASDGRIIVPIGFNSIVLRLNASGSSGSDEWAVNNVKAHIQACDPTAPTVLSNYKVSGGRHQKGNTIYVSVAFSEIVTVTGTPTLSSNWGTLSYVAGSGSNVLTFKGTIDPIDNNPFSVSSYSGTIKDLAGNSFSGSISYSFGTTLDSDYVWSTADFRELTTQTYEIYTTLDMRHLALMVNSGNNDCSGLTFRQTHDITYTHTTNWNNANSTENNYTAIGTYNNPFLGTFDGQGYTVSGIRIYRGGTSNSDYYQGLFGAVKRNGTVKRVTLSDARITGYHEVGGIAAHTYYSFIEDCTVDANVCIHAVQSNTYDHGGIVGYNQAGPVNRCISRATLTVANSSGCKDFGGIVGLNKSNVITDCIAEGVVIPDVNARGAIVGYKDDYYGSTLTRNYYHDCKVASNSVTPSGVGMGTTSSKTTSDETGAQPLWAITLPTHASVVRTGTALPGTDNAIYDNGADINGVPYAKGLSVVNLSYDPATITEGYDVLLSVKKTSDNTAVTFTDNDDHTYTIPSMPAADISVSVTQIPVISYIDADGNARSHGCTPIVSDIHTYQTPGRTDAWYVVNNDVTDDYAWSSKFEDKAVHIILCDGKTFYRETSATGYSAIEVINGSLSIYGQSLGTGRLIATSRSTAIFVKSDINFNGGIVSSSTTNYNSVYTQNGDITIRRGNITAQAATYGINSKSGTIILGCSSTADHITANGYYAEKGVKVADGQTLTDGISSHTFTGTLSSDQKAAIAGKTLMKSLGNVAYLDGNGQAQTCTDYTILWDSTIPVDGSDEGSIGTADQDSWYVASTNYTFGKKLNALGHVHLILLDGTTFTVNGTETGLNSKDLSIYGQSLGTGTLTASATDKAMFVDGNLVINGGITHATGGNYGIYVDGGNLTVNGGSINATGTTSGIYARGNLTLGWNKLSDRITANSYSCTGTISVKEGQQLHNGSSLLSGTLYNHNGGNPIGDLSVLAGLTLKPAVPYITADGTTQYCGEYTVLESSNEQFADYGISGQENWYVVSGNVTFDGQLRFNDSHSHLIVCDGAHLTASAPVASEDAIYGHNVGITIYGQTLGTGTITANGASNGCGIGSGSNITINGGTIIATGMYGFYSTLDGIIINRGTVTVTGTDTGIYSDGNNVTINGGIVNATGGIVGIYAGETITLGWTNPTDRITVSSYAVGDIIASGHYYIRVKNGQTLTDGTNGYSGTLYDINNGTITGDASVLAGKTLQPCYSITLPAHVIATGVISQNGTTAYAMPPAAITLSAEANFALANVEVNGTPATDNGDGTWSFTMPAEDVTVTATVSVPYIAADGTTQYCASYTLIESSQYNVSLGNINNDEAWYVVPAGEVTISGRLYCSDKAVHLILCDGAELTVTYSGSSDAVNTPYSLTIYGQSAQSGRLTATATGSTGCGIKADEGDITVNGGIISATSAAREGIYAQYCSVTINRGSVTATSNSTAYTPYGIHAKNDITINGGIVSATGNSYGINATGTITLGWTNATDHIYASSYDGTVVVKSGQTLTDDTNTYSGSVNKSSIAGKTLSPVLVLADNADNTSAIATNNGSTLAVQLTGRTLYKDGDWNTLCLPFDLASLTGTPLEGATVKTLTSTAFADGTLTLNFTEDANNLTSIEAGKPYIVKWSKPDGYDGHGSDYDLQNPVFTGVTIESDMDNVTTDYVTFCGTYSPIDYACDNNSILFLGLHNTLYYPQAGAHIGAFRAYFELRNGLTAASITNARLAFDDEEETTSMVDVRGKMADGRSDIYNLNGQKVLNPTKGLYIVNGRKVIIK